MANLFPDLVPGAIEKKPVEVGGGNLFPDLVESPREQVVATQENTTAPLDNIELIEGGAQSLLEGATLGFSDEIQSVIAATVSAPFIKDKTFGQLMVDARESFREDQKRFSEQAPIADIVNQVVGGIATGGAGLAKSAGAQTLKQAIGQGAKTGAVVGTAAGAGFADKEEFLSQETLVEAAKTGALSTVLGGLTPAIIKGAISTGKLIPKALPESLMETAVKVRPSVPNNKRASMIRTALNEGIMPTTKGLELISKKLTNLDRSLDNIIDGATKKGILIPKRALFTELKQLRKDLGGVNLRGGKNKKQIESIAAAFDMQLKSIDKTKLTPREVQDLKRSAYQQLKFDINQQSSSFATTEAEKAIIRGGKKSLEGIDKNVKKINQREGKLLELGEELERAVSRLDNRNLISLDTAAKVAAGAATGSPVGAAVGTGSAVLGAPRVKARIALILENIRKASEISETAGKSLSPEAMKAFSILVEDSKNQLNGLIDE